MKLILASASPRRERLLREAGFDPEVVPSGAAEPESGADPAGRARDAARLKCDAVAPRFPDAVVLAADTLVAVGSRVLGKPRDRDDARAMLLALAGRDHEVLSAVRIEHRASGRILAFCERSRTRFKALGALDVESYLNAVDVSDKAGAYGIQERADLIGAEVQGSFTNVVGLPVERVIPALRWMGVTGAGAVPRPRIGSRILSSPLVLGGLAGYGDPWFRSACLRAGAGAVFTPQMLDRTLAAAARRGAEPPRPGDATGPVIAQIVGREPAEMADAAALLAEGGFAGLDVNFACPAPKLLRKQRGGALLADPDRALSILAAVRAAWPGPLSVKLRSGLDDTEASRARVLSILDGAVALPVEAVTIHPRTVAQRYKGRADWSVLARAHARFPGLTLLGSGDVHTASDALRMLAETGVAAVALGRGALGNPWVFREGLDLLSFGESRPPDPAARAAWLPDYAAALFAGLPSRKALVTVRKQGIKAARFSPAPKQGRLAFAAASTRAALDAAIRLLGTAPADP